MRILSMPDGSEPCLVALAVDRFTVAFRGGDDWLVDDILAGGSLALPRFGNGLLRGSGSEASSAKDGRELLSFGILGKESGSSGIAFGKVVLGELVLNSASLEGGSGVGTLTGCGESSDGRLGSSGKAELSNEGNSVVPGSSFAGLGRLVVSGNCRAIGG
jgi:hypothetical protein